MYPRVSLQRRSDVERKSIARAEGERGVGDGGEAIFRARRPDNKFRREALGASRNSPSAYTRAARGRASLSPFFSIVRHTLSAERAKSPRAQNGINRISENLDGERVEESSREARGDQRSTVALAVEPQVSKILGIRRYAEFPLVSLAQRCLITRF